MKIFSTRHAAIRPYRGTVFFSTQRFLLVALLACSVSACTKDSPAPDATTSLLAAHPWRIVAFTNTDLLARPVKTEDWQATMAAYRKDDFYEFKADNSLVFHDGTLKAKADDPTTAGGRWQFENEQTQLTITLNKTVPLGTTGVSSSSTYTILELSATTLRLTSGNQAQTVFVTLAP